MTKIQYFGLCGVLGIGAFLGSYAAGWKPNAAVAQTRVQNQDYLLIPNSGLRLVTEQGHPVGMIGQRGGNGVFILLDSSGQPSITLNAGAGGKVTVNAESEANLMMNTANNGSGVRLSTSSAASQLSFLRGGQAATAISDAPTGGRLVIGARSNRPAVELSAGTGGGQLNLLNDAGTSFIQLLLNENAGRMQISDPASSTIFTLNGKGSAFIRRGEETIWSVPANKND